uniref:Uncharacterized protein n=1 Tax=Rhodnius prolixus TaxID=13249 RepID=T1HEI9_RHOPR
MAGGKKILFKRGGDCRKEWFACDNPYSYRRALLKKVLIFEKADNRKAAPTQQRDVPCSGDKANSASLVTTRPSTPASSPPSATPASTASPTPRLAASLPPALPAHLQPSGLLKVSDEAVGIPAASPGSPRSPVRPAAEKSHSSSPSPHISDVENPSPPPYITRVKCASPPLHITGTENASPSPPISRAECSSMPHIPEAEDVSPSLPLFEELPPASPPSYSSGVECTSPSLYNSEVECLSPPPHHTEAEGASPPQSPLFPTSEEPPITSPASLAPLTAQAEDAFPPQSTLLTASKESRPAPLPSRISGAECASPHSEAVRPPPPLHVIRAECPPPCCTVNAEPVSGSVCTSTADDPIDSALHSLTPPHLQECTLGSSGPARLSEPLDNGPRRPASPDSTAMCMYQEAKPPVKVALVTTAPEDNIISQFSSLLHRQRITAYCLRFGFNCRNPTTPRHGELSSLELQNALSHIIRVIHEEQLINIPHAHRSLQRSMNGLPLMLFDDKGTPLTDENGLPLHRDGSKEPMIVFDIYGRPSSTETGAKLFDHAGRCNHHPQFALIEEMNKPDESNCFENLITVYDNEGRPVKDIDGRSLQ